MYSLLNGIKQKKRKTRKCLDEIRKRSRRIGQPTFSESTKSFGFQTIYSKDTHKECISTVLSKNRLTLRMFPKAIQSETITRPILAELKQRPKLNLGDLVKTNVKSTVLHSNHVCITQSKNNIEQFGGNNALNTTAEKDYSKIEISPALIPGITTLSTDSSQDDAPVSLGLFSSSTTGEETDKSSDSIPALSYTNLSKGPHDNFSYNLYEEFMYEMPTYLKQNTFPLYKKDVMEETKLFLHSVSIQAHNQEHDDENTMDYISEGHSQPQRRIHKIADSSPHAIISHFPIEPPYPKRTMIASDMPLSFVVSDTPEYTFYPHKLN